MQVFSLCIIDSPLNESLLVTALGVMRILMTLSLDFTEHALYSQSVLVGHNLGGDFTWNLPRQTPRADDIALGLHRACLVCKCLTSFWTIEGYSQCVLWNVECVAFMWNLPRCFCGHDMADDLALGLHWACLVCKCLTSFWTIASYWAVQMGLLTPLTFAWHCLSPLAAFTSSAYFLHNVQTVNLRFLCCQL